MIVVRTPHRVSLVGGGTDLRAWCDHQPGAVIGFALKRYCYVFLRELPHYDGYRHRIVWSKTELVNSIEEIQHPAVRALLTEYPVDHGIEIHHAADVPARAGLGSSSSFTVALLLALKTQHTLRTFLARVGFSAERLAREAIRLEQEVMGEAVGAQDQVFAAYGGFRTIRFRADRYDLLSLVLRAEAEAHLLSHLLLVFTGVQRFAVEVERKKIEQVHLHHDALARLVALVEEARDAIIGEQIEVFANVLHESWEIKRSLAGGVSTPRLDEIYETALRHGALGGKLLGAGGGGCFLFVVPPPRRAHLIETLGLLEIPLAIDHEGARVVYQD